MAAADIPQGLRPIIHHCYPDSDRTARPTEARSGRVKTKQSRGVLSLTKKSNSIHAGVHTQGRTHDQNLSLSRP